MCLVAVVVVVVFCPSSRFLISRMPVRAHGLGLRRGNGQRKEII